MQKVMTDEKVRLYVWRYYFVCKRHADIIRQYVSKKECYSVGFVDKQNARCYFCSTGLDPVSLLEKKQR
jgi:hypothetical protein